MMSDVRKLIGQLADEEHRLQGRTFLAPVVRGGQVRTRISGLIYTFTPRPRRREGWGLFRPLDASTVAWIGEASLAQVEAYLHLLQPFRLHLARHLRGRSWLAYPGHAGDVYQRLGRCQPVLVHLVSRGNALETLVARWDGAVFWGEDLDRRADPRLAETLRDALNKAIPAAALRHPGLTPEQRTAYALALEGRTGRRVSQGPPDDRSRLERALAMGGGQLRDFEDRDDCWLVEWSTREGERHSSAIAKPDLTVIGAGICLDGQDHHFDLQSLVGVVEQRPDWM